MLLCKFCNKECKNDNSQRNHQRLCKSNPDIADTKPKSAKWYQAMRDRKTLGVGSNQWIKAKQTGIDYVVKEETRKKLSNASSKQRHSEETKKKISEGIKKAIERNPNAYTSSNRGRTKEIIYNGIKFQGRWELEFFQFCESNDIQITRPNEWFEYTWNGARKYFPDFYLSEYDLYVEVKGYETERDHAKWSQFPKKLKVVKQNEIYAIRNGTFNWADSLAS